MERYEKLATEDMGDLCHDQLPLRKNQRIWKDEVQSTKKSEDIRAVN